MPTSYSYTVTLFDPSVLNVPPTIAGSSTPPTTGVDLHVQQHRPGGRLRTAGDHGKRRGVDRRCGGPIHQISLRDEPEPIRYDNPQSCAPAQRRSNSRSRLRGPELRHRAGRHSIGIEHLQFYNLGRFATTTTTFNAEISTNNGSTWSTLWSRIRSGPEQRLLGPCVHLRHSVSLAAYAGQIVRIRFIVRWNGQSISPRDISNHGFFIDDVSVTNATELVSETTTLLAGTATVLHTQRRHRRSAADGWHDLLPACPAECRHPLVFAGLATENRDRADSRPATRAGWPRSYPAVTGGPTADHDGTA